MNDKLPELGRLEAVPLRTVWAHEANDLTPWLAQNLDRLSHAIQLGPLNLIGIEQSVGPFSVDVLAETQAGERVVIENQLEVSDHTHLGQIITYASGVGAPIVVWVLKRLQDEHRAAIDWLNEHTDEETSFFVIELRVVQIGDSAPAPVFDVVARPNDWQKRTRARSVNTSWRGWGVLEAALAAVPSGRWVTVGDLASIVGTTAGWIGRRLATNVEDHSGRLHRVVEPTGAPWPHYRVTSEQDKADPMAAQRLLEAEGVAFNNGLADPSCRMTADELTALLDAGSTGRPL